MKGKVGGQKEGGRKEHFGIDIEGGEEEKVFTDEREKRVEKKGGEWKRRPEKGRKKGGRGEREVSKERE